MKILWDYGWLIPPVLGAIAALMVLAIACA